MFGFTNHNLKRRAGDTASGRKSFHSAVSPALPLVRSPILLALLELSRKRFYLLTIILCIFWVTVNAQDDCLQNIKVAEDLYNGGDYESCIPLLEKSKKECHYTKKDKAVVNRLLEKAYLEIIRKPGELYNGGDYENCITLLEKALGKYSFSKKEKVKIYELLAKAYLEMDQTWQAETSVKSLLKSNPDYELKEDENPEDYNRLVKKYIVHAGLTFGVKNAIMIPEFVTTKTYSLRQDVDYSISYKTNPYYLNYYGLMEIQPSRSFSIDGELMISTVSYNRNLENSSKDWFLYYSESLTFLEIPLYLKKSFRIRNFIYNFSVGFSWMYLAQSTGYASVIKNGYNYYTSGINTLPQRNRNNFEFLTGASIGYKFKNLRIYLDFRVLRGMTNLVNGSNRMTNDELINFYNYVDNDFHYNKGTEVGVTISYIFKNTVRKK